jgi:hypothetical protein
MKRKKTSKETFDQKGERLSINKGDGTKNTSWKKFGGKWYLRDNFQYRKDKIDAKKSSAKKDNLVRTVKDGKWTSLYRRPKK